MKRKETHRPGGTQKANDNNDQLPSKRKSIHNQLIIRFVRNKNFCADSAANAQKQSKKKKKGKKRKKTKSRSQNRRVVNQESCQLVCNRDVFLCVFFLPLFRFQFDFCCCCLPRRGERKAINILFSNFVVVVVCCNGSFTFYGIPIDARWHTNTCTLRHTHMHTHIQATHRECSDINKTTAYKTIW